MIPDTLLERIDSIFTEMGGLDAATELFSDIALIDIALFNGYTFLLFPYYEENDQVLTNGIDTYNNLDLRPLDYKRGSAYSVVDITGMVVYTGVAAEVEIDNEVKYLFGYSELDKLFLTNLKHGAFYYVIYDKQGESDIFQLIVSYRLPQSVIDRNLTNWKAAAESLQQEIKFDSTLLVNLNTELTLHVARVAGRLQDNYTEPQIYHHMQATQDVVVDIPTLYMVFSTSSWLTFREYSVWEAETEVNELLYQNWEDAKDVLEGLGYEQVTDKPAPNLYRTYVYTKTLVDTFAEIVLLISREYEVVELSASQYRVLPLTTIEGTKSEAIRIFDEGSAFLLASSEYEVSSTGTPVLVRDPFHLTAELEEL